MRMSTRCWVVGVSLFAAVGCGGSVRHELPDDTALEEQDAGSDARTGAGEESKPTKPNPPAMGVDAGKPEPEPEPGPCNGGVLVKKGDGFVCDCSDAPQGGPFCDGEDDGGAGDNERVISISADSYYTCALLESGSVRCWGDNASGTLGNGSFTGSAVPVAVKNLSDVRQLDLGLLHACAVIQDGSVRCWGRNSSDMLRDGSNNDRNVPVTAKGLQDVVQVSLGESQSCARFGNGGLECWGGHGHNSPLPIEANRANPVVDVEAGYFNTTAWFKDGSVQSWGEHTLPLLIESDTITRVASGYGFVCALTEEGSVWCAGWNHEGQLGTGAPEDGGTGQVAGLLDAVDIAAGFEHACAVRSNGRVQCWGQNNRGQLGDGTGDDRRTPTEVFGLEHVEEVACGREHCCARKEVGDVVCWGNNAHGQLGDGTMTDNSKPVAVNGL